MTEVENQTNGAEKSDTPVENGKITEDVKQKIVTQIEYYFGDYNLPRDKFLKEEVRN